MKRVYSLIAQRTITNTKKVIVNGVEKLKVTYRDGKVKYKKTNKKK